MYWRRLLRLYPQYVYDEAAGHETGELLPESDWYVAMRPDTLPHLWPYEGYRSFAPQVSELRRRKS